MHRAHEQRLRVTPTHAPRNRQRLERLLDQRGQQTDRCSPLFETLKAQVLIALIVALGAERIECHAHALSEREAGAGGDARGIEARAQRWSTAHDALIGLM